MPCFEIPPEAGTEMRIHVQKCVGGARVVAGEGDSETGEGTSQFLSGFPQWVDL